MTSTSNDHQSLSTHLAAPIEVGEPDVAGALAVYPLFGPAAGLEYVAFADPKAKTTVGELEGGASVNNLLVHNAGSQPVLFYEGEEVIGAQQNRVLDVAALVAAGAKISVPVSCVERGRWDGRRHRERFRPSRQAADPRMRRMKSRQARSNVAAGREARADQSEVWREVDARQIEFGAASPTAAMSDIYDANRDRLGSFREAISLQPGQCGSVAVIDGRIEMLDFVGRPGVYSFLHGAIVEGYALDALAVQRRGGGERLDRGNGQVDVATVRGFTLLACDAVPSSRTDGPGIGATARFAAGGIEGSALIAEAELVQLTAFPTGEDEAAPPGARPNRRISRPSRRRR